MKPRLALAFAFLIFAQTAPCQSVVNKPAVVATPQSAGVQVTSKPSSPTFVADFGKLPLSFEANQGQSGPEVKFLSRGNGYSLFLTDTAAILSLSMGEPRPKDAVAKRFPAKDAPAKLKTWVFRIEKQPNYSLKP